MCSVVNHFYQTLRIVNNWNVFTVWRNSEMKFSLIWPQQKLFSQFSIMTIFYYLPHIQYFETKKNRSRSSCVYYSYGPFEVSANLSEKLIRIDICLTLLFCLVEISWNFHSIFQTHSFYFVEMDILKAEIARKRKLLEEKKLVVRVWTRK